MDQSILKDVLATFSPQGDYFALSTGDGRVKIWDSRNGQLHTEFADTVASTSKMKPSDNSQNGHLALEYTAMCWGYGRGMHMKKGDKKDGKGGLSLLASGTSSGDILAWDTNLGELKWRTNNCNVGRVQTVTFAKKGKRLYCGGVDGVVCELDSNSGELLEKFRATKAPISSISISSGGDLLLVGASEIKLFDLSSKKRLQKFTGHPISVRFVTFTPDGKYAISSGAGDPHLAIWDCEERGHNKGAAFILSMEHPAVAVDCSNFQLDKGTFEVLALSEMGVAFVWHAKTIEGLPNTKPMRLTVSRISGENGSSGKNRPCILAAKLLNGSEAGPGRVLVAYGSTVRPLFKHITRVQGSDVLLDGAHDGALLSIAEPNKQNVNNTDLQEVTILGPDNAADAVFPKARIESESPIKAHTKRKRASNDKSDFVDVHGGDSKVDEHVAEEATLAEVGEGDEPTMEERLIALGLGEDKRAEGNALDTTLELPKADSMEVLLSQALQSDDNALLERCLAVSDKKVIANTVQRLQALDAAKFLQVSISKMESRPRRGLVLIPWVRAILLYHSGFIMSSPAMQSVLTSLYQIIDARISVFKPLLSLAGRLDLIMAQISANESRNKATNEANTAIVYEEEDTEEEDEDIMEEESDDSDLSERETEGLEVDADEDLHMQGQMLSDDDNASNDEAEDDDL